MRRCHQQAQQQEHAGLRQPSHAVHHLQHVRGGARALVADDHTGKINRKEAAAAQLVGGGEHRQAARDDQQGVKPLGQAHAPQQLGKQAPSANAECGADHELRYQLQKDTLRRGHAGAGDDAYQHGNQQDGHRIIGPGFDFQRCADPLVEAHAAVAQEIEDGGGIGRTDDGPHQQSVAPVHAEQPGTECTQQRGGGDHAPGGECRRRPKRDAKGRDARAQAAIEQDDRQRQIADKKRGTEIVEADSPRTVFAGQHADDEKYQQEGKSEARRKCAGQHAEKQQDARKQQQGIDLIHVRRLLGFGNVGGIAWW
jgi:hypothetical protein